MASNLQDNDLYSALDNHNIANGDPSWFERKMDATGNLLTSIGEGATLGLAGSVVAGVNAIVNTAASVGSFLGMDTEQTSTYDVLKGLDDDLAKYYQGHEQGVELGGFILGSIAPGMAGVKALQAAKAGVMGSNTLGSMGLMKSLTADYAKLATREFALTETPFTLLNANVIKGLAQGYGSQVLEAAAFNTAATAALYKSPTLSQQSISDLFWDDITGSLVWGGIGGTVVGAKGLFGINKGLSSVKQELLGQSHITKLPNEDNVEPILSVLTAYKNKFDLQAPIELFPVKDSMGLSGKELLNLKLSTRDKTLATVENNILGALNKFAGGDTEIGNALYTSLKDATKFEDVLQSLGPAARVAGRIGTEDTIASSEIYYMAHGAKYEKFQDILRAGAHDELFTGKGTDISQGFQIVGDISTLKVTGARQAGILSAGAKEDAFRNGYDVFRNPNGTYSVNPESKILLKVTDKPIENKILIDLEDGLVKNKGTPGLADLATKTNPIVVKGDIVMAGKLPPIRINTKGDFNPLDKDLMAHEVQAQTIWARETPLVSGMRVGENNIPLLDRLYQEQLAGTLERKTVYITNETGQVPLPDSFTLRNYIIERKQALLKQGGDMPVEELSLRLNVSDKFITDGDASGWMKITKESNIQTPRYAKVIYDPKATESIPMMNANAHQGALEYARQVAAVKTRVQQNFTAYAEELASLFPEGVKATDPRWNSASQGAGAGIATFANANPGTYAAWAQYTGQQFDKLLMNKRTASAEKLNTAFARMSIDTVGLPAQEKLAEFGILNNELRKRPAMAFHPDGSNTLVLKSEYKAIAKGELEPTEFITVKSQDVVDALKTHMELNTARQSHIANMKGSAGVADAYEAATIYPIPINTEKLNHFVLVKPRAPVSLGDKARVIAAKDEATLKRLVAEVDQTQFEVQTKGENEAWHRAKGDYDSALGMNDSSVDSALTREGKLSQHFPTTGDGFLTEMMDWHMRQEELLARSMVYHRYSQEFEELKALGKQHLNMETSKFGFLSKGIERAVKDPYNDIIKTALNISRSSEYQPWTNFNNFVKESIERPINKLGEIWNSNPKIDVDFVNKVNAISKEMGVNPPFNTAMSHLIANGNIPSKPWLSLGISKVQAVLSTTLLQWDSFNAVNNLLGNAILSAPEMNSVLKAISSGNSEVAGKLTQLMQVKVPGSEVTMPTTKKLVMQAIHNYSKDPEVTAALMERYRNIGTITDLSQQARDSFNRLTIDWRTVTEGQVQSNVEKAAEFGRKWTGNKRAEEFNRFIASDIMRQVTQLAEDAGVMTRNESNEYIQMFVNRTQGNSLYSQRPIVFQGVVGQAISLFQTYQFNLMQQLMRHVASGDSKSAAMMMGLQGSIYGMNGLPAFNFLNTHIIGNAAGNTSHQDITQSVYGAMGEDIASWVMYGAGSNAFGLVDPRMKINLYSRGDINPRQLTVLPTQLADVPIVNASVKFVSNLWNAADKIDNGGSVWNSVSQAVEHNGLSRPLAGLASIAQGYTTTNQGSLLTGGQDMFDVATLTRLAGGKPFNEAVALDVMYRANAYKAKDARDIASLGSAIKTTLVGNQNPTSEQLNEFATSYAKNGGKIENFNKFFANASLSANRSQVNALSQNLSKTTNRQVMNVMGGVPLDDFTNTQK